MTPREFLEQVVRPNLADLEADFGDVRKAFNALHSVDALAAQIFHGGGGKAAGLGKSDTAFREQLANENEDFRLVRDAAKAVKHGKLEQGSPEISSAKDIASKSLGWGQVRWGEGRWGGPPQVVVTTKGGGSRVLETLLTNAIIFLESKMTALGL